MVGKIMHPLVRALYKQALHVGRDYPLGLNKVRNAWKEAIRNPENCPSCYDNIITRRDDDRRMVDDNNDNNNNNSSSSNDCKNSSSDGSNEYHNYPTDIINEEQEIAIPENINIHSKECEKELRKAVGKGRYMIREMIGVIQLKKYRSIKRSYGNSSSSSTTQFNEYLSKIQNGEGNCIETEDDHNNNNKRKDT
jgi:hypothetical protein